MQTQAANPTRLAQSHQKAFVRVVQGFLGSTIWSKYSGPYNTVKVDPELYYLFWLSHCSAGGHQKSSRIRVWVVRGLRVLGFRACFRGRKSNRIGNTHLVAEFISPEKCTLSVL